MCGGLPGSFRPPIRVRSEEGEDSLATRRLPTHRDAPGRTSLRGDVLLHPRGAIKGARGGCGGSRPRGTRPSLARTPARGRGVPPASHAVPQSQGGLHRAGSGAVLSAQWTDPWQVVGRPCEPEAGARLARPRNRWPWLEGGESLPSKHRTWRPTRDSRSAYPEESDSPRSDSADAAHADRESISCDRVAHGMLLRRHRDPDGRARPLVLEPRDGRDFQVIRRDRGERRGREVVLTLFKVDI